VQPWDLLAIDAPEGTRDPVVLYQDDGARAVLIVLRPGQELGQHQVKENTWLTVIDGTIRVTAAGQTVDAGRGSFFRFAPDERHAVASDEGAHVLLVLAPWPGAGHYRGERVGG